MDDLISREANMKVIKSDKVVPLCRLLMCGVSDGLADAMCKDLQEIVDMHAFDAAPVVHGRWITLWPNSGHSRRPTKCSACGAWGRNQEKHKDNYCPSCGARMDLPEGEEAQNDG